MMQQGQRPWRRIGQSGGAARATIAVDGEAIEALEGECLATALAASGRLRLGESPAGRPRGAFCMMGVCQQCVALVDGAARPTCMTAVRDGMRVEVSLRTAGDGKKA